MTTRDYSETDQLLMLLDKGIATVFGTPQVTERPNPSEAIEETELTAEDKTLSGRLMRINHAGEVAAQGLYQGQALTAKLPDVREKMERAALEENDHLAWCRKRANEMGTHTSYLDPLWYTGSAAIGAIAGIIGDKWSLGFVAETEHQVVKHLDEHLSQLPENDNRSKAILEKMREDEGHHATAAIQAGGESLPKPVKKLMALTSKIMTRTAYWV
jgi:ubiquinone biosynthesis monooxygenase Coq7